MVARAGAVAELCELAGLGKKMLCLRGRPSPQPKIARGESQESENFKVTELFAFTVVFWQSAEACSPTVDLTSPLSSPNLPSFANAVQSCSHATVLVGSNPTDADTSTPSSWPGTAMANVVFSSYVAGGFNGPVQLQSGSSTGVDILSSSPFSNAIFLLLVCLMLIPALSTTEPFPPDASNVLACLLGAVELLLLRCSASSFSSPPSLFSNVNIKLTSSSLSPLLTMVNSKTAVGRELSV
mmetsp:Transcript_11291/g.20480  ORF Transcript_11291/g.20480 Transcript_11291/m.20480 type:complete len:240 (+) Transcript_11291:1524-2243(+)